MTSERKSEWNDIMDKDYFGKYFNTTKLYPKKIFINQLGYPVKGEKRAIITKPCESFTLKEAGTGRIAYSGMTTHFGIDAASQDDVYIADFSTFEYKGRYYVDAEGECSFTFDIGEGVYHQLSIDILRMFYFMRCGIDLTEECAGQYTHPACHTADALLWEDNSISKSVTGGWHDAGDYGRYVTPGATAAAHLMYAYKLFPKSYEDLCLNIPESGNGTPDILNECRVELEWIAKMQCEDGGVYHKATTQFHADFCMPQDDTRQMYLFPVSSIATADLAGLFALAYRIYKPYDSDFADKLLEQAKLSGKWLENNPEFKFEYPKNHGTGGYGEWRDYDNRFWAWTELYLSTGQKHYRAKMLKALEEQFNPVDLGVGSVGGFGTLSYILWGEEEELKDKFKQNYIHAAEHFAKISDECGWGSAMIPENYCWGSNMGLGKNGMIFAIADYIEQGDRFKDYARKQLDFLLGVNASGYSWVTGEGEFSINYPHLRTAHADGIEKCMPGFVSGGPNRHRQDHVAKKMIPEGTPPMKCFIDEVGTFSVNEITIYWNSPFVFLTGYLDE